MSDIDLKSVDTVWLDQEKKCVSYIDQTKLPNEIIIKEIDQLEDMYVAIKDLEVRGAPAIGVFAAISMYVYARDLVTGDEVLWLDEFYNKYIQASAYLNSSRPTAVNLSWALACMQEALDEVVSAILRGAEIGSCLDDSEICNKDIETLDTAAMKKVSLDATAQDRIISALESKAVRIWEEDIETCRRIGEYGAKLIKDGDGLLTHCNAGRLATVRYGTATAPMYVADEQGKRISVYCDETRPVLQGARLTSFELSEYGIDTTLLCDNMAASLMKEGKIQAVFVGCDRVAANGDAANKIGTSQVAIMAKYYGVPFYVCGPLSTIDMNTACGDDIVIEQRDGSEVTALWYKEPMATDKVKVYNPAFDVTPAELITGIITEKGIIKAPYKENLAKLF